VERVGVDAPLAVLSYVTRRCGQALLTFGLFAVAVALLVTGGARGGGSALDWLAAAARLDFGRASNSPVIVAITAALPATALLVLAATLIGIVVGYGGGLLLTLTDPALTPQSPLPLSRIGLPVGPADKSRVLWYAPVRILAVAADVCQGVPVFWLGGVLVVVLSVGLGLFPPGGIADPALPAFGTAPYLDLLRARPAIVLGDLLGRLALPALTLALAGLATRLRLVSTALPPELRALHARGACGWALQAAVGVACGAPGAARHHVRRGRKPGSAGWGGCVGRVSFRLARPGVAGLPRRPCG